MNVFRSIMTNVTLILEVYIQPRAPTAQPPDPWPFLTAYSACQGKPPGTHLRTDQDERKCSRCTWCSTTFTLRRVVIEVAYSDRQVKELSRPSIGVEPPSSGQIVFLDYYKIVKHSPDSMRWSRVFSQTPESKVGVSTLLLLSLLLMI